MRHFTYPMIGQLASEISMFESVDDDGRTSATMDACYIIASICESSAQSYKMKAPANHKDVKY